MSAQPIELDVVPGVRAGGGPGWYLIGADKHVEVGPFGTAAEAEQAAEWMDQHGYGRHPAPWTPRWSPRGLLLDTRLRDGRRQNRQSAGLAAVP